MTMTPAQRLGCVFFAALAFSLAGCSDAADAELLKRIEVGDVAWGRDLRKALGVAQESGKPVLLLFQEVPGCAGCQKFGRDVLKHPLIVEAAEDEFVPVVVFNNRGGYDAQVLKQYREPAWNYQVIRFLGPDGKDLIPRRDGVWTLGGIAARMQDAPRAGGRDVPRYLETLVEEGPVEEHAVAALGMHCFWTGERKLGGLDGVVSTEAGWIDGREVTRVVYRRDRISFEELLRKAQQSQCALSAYADDREDQSTARSVGIDRVGPLSESYRKARESDQKKQVSNLPLRRVPGLTSMQRTKLNAFGRSDWDQAVSWLSPRQRAALSAGGNP